MRDLVVKASWFEGFEDAPEELKKEIFYRIIKQGCFEEEVDCSNDDFSLKSNWIHIQGNIQRMKESQEQKQEFGKTHGRKPMANEQKIYEYLQQHPSARAAEIGAALGLDKGHNAKGDYAYIYDMAVWRNRKKIQLGVSFEEFSSGKEIPNSGKNSENRIPIPENSSEIQNAIPEKIPKKVGWVF
jgi:hypothetical protein